METTTANHTGRHVIYSPSLPSGTGPARKFEPLKRRTSPLPWDREGLEAHWANRSRDFQLGFRVEFKSELANRWAPLLHPLKVGETVKVHVSKTAARRACEYHGAKLGRVYEVTGELFGQFIITRVK